MKRKTKNIIMICTILLLLGTSFITMYTGIINKVGTPESTAGNLNNVEEERIIENKPSIENATPSTGEPLPEGVIGEEPDGSNAPAEMFDEGYSEDAPPSLPEGENISEGGLPPSLPEGEEFTEDGPPPLPSTLGEKQDNSKYFPAYCILFFVQNTIISSLLVYLIMTNFNKTKIKKKKQKIIAIICILLLTGTLTYLEGNILNKKSTENSEINFIQTIDTSNIEYESIKNVKDNENISNKQYGTKEKEEIAILVNGDINTKIENTIVEKYGASSNSEEANMYGFNSGILVKSGAKATLNNMTVNTYGASSNGVFCLGNNSKENPTKVTISDSTITTKTYNSGGIMASLGCVLNAKKLTITTSGMSSAAIRTDHGGGEVNVDGGTYVTNGPGSPTIYATGDIEVKNAKLVSNTSEGIVIEGDNSVSLNNCDLTTNNTKLVGQSTEHNGIFMYHSFDNIKRENNSKFTSKNSVINILKGNTFFISNTDAKLELTNNKIVNTDPTGNFLVIKAGGWGVTNTNGGNVNLVLNKQTITGNIITDKLSELKMNMKNNSSYEGTINKDNQAKNIELTLEKTSKIKLTGDSYITSLENENKKNTNIDFNGFKLYVNGKAIN